MKIGLSGEMYPPKFSVEEALRHAASCGADGYELTIPRTGPVSLEHPDGFEHIRQAAIESGMEIPSMVCPVHWEMPLTDPDPEHRAIGMAALEQVLEVGQRLGIGLLLLVPGVVTATVPYADAYGRAQEAVRRLARRAEDLGMRIGIENVWNKFLLSPLEMVRFIDEIGSSAVGAYFDVGNIMAYGFPQHWIATLGSRILAVHVKDYRTDVAGYGGFVYLLQGNVPWQTVRTELEHIGYNGYITAELPPYRIFPEDAATDAVRAMRRIFACER